MNQRADEKTLSNIWDACQPQCAAASYQAQKHRLGLIVHGVAQGHFRELKRTGNSREELIAPVSRPTFQALTTKRSLVRGGKTLSDKPKLQPPRELFDKAFI